MSFIHSCYFFRFINIFRLFSLSLYYNFPFLSLWTREVGGDFLDEKSVIIKILKWNKRIEGYIIKFESNLAWLVVRE